MTKRILLLLCACILWLEKVPAHECSLFRNARANVILDLFSRSSVLYYAQHAVLPADAAQLEDSKAFQTELQIIEQLDEHFNADFSKENVCIRKISPRKIEITMIDGNKNDVYCAVHEIDENMQTVTYFVNEEFSNGFHYEKEGRLIETFSSRGHFSLDYADSDTGVFLLRKR